MGIGITKAENDVRPIVAFIQEYKKKALNRNLAY